MDAKEIFEKMGSLEFEDQVWIVRQIDKSGSRALNSAAFIDWVSRNTNNILSNVPEDSVKIENMTRIIDRISCWSLESQVWIVQQIYHQFPEIVATKEYTDFIDLNCHKIAAAVFEPANPLTTSKSDIIEEVCKEQGISYTVHPTKRANDPVDFIGMPVATETKLENNTAVIENAKYDIGDPVWFLNGSTIVCAPIENITFDRNMPKNYQITYKLQGWEGTFSKESLYGTLKEAMKGLDKK